MVLTESMDQNGTDNIIGIEEFFANRSVFITGGSGLVGKVLIEKLLRSCPRINTIYVLLRPKKGKSINERLREITDVELFDRVKRERPNFVERKLVPIAGDVSSLNLGLSADDRKILEDNVSVVFHSAASVRFNDPLKYATLMNVRGTREIMTLAKNMKQLAIFTHVSTMYCNINQKTVEEKMYPAMADWKKTIEIAEKVDDETIKPLTALYMNHYPNTYTFSKHLSEQVVNDLCKEFNLNSVIFRLGIVTSSSVEPFPGWIDNISGIVGLLALSGKGLIGSFLYNPDVNMDWIPVDVSVKSMIVASWAKTVNKTPQSPLCDVFNGTGVHLLKMNLSEIIRCCKKIMVNKLPFEKVLYYPGGSCTQNIVWHYIRFLFFHFIPAFFVDTFLKLSGRKPRLLGIVRKLYIATVILRVFVQTKWTFINDKCLDLNDKILEVDWNDWSFHEPHFKPKEYLHNLVFGLSEYLLHEKIQEKSKVYLKRLFWIDVILKTFGILALLYVLFYKIDVLGIFYFVFTMLF